MDAVLSSEPCCLCLSRQSSIESLLVSSLQWWKVTEFVYSSTVLKFNFELLVLHCFLFLPRDTSTLEFFLDNFSDMLL